MTNNFENGYRDIIFSLKKLKSTRAPASLSEKISSRLRLTYNFGRQPLVPFYLFRLAILSLLLAMILGGGVVLAAEKSQPGQFLYPLKQTIDKAKTETVNKIFPPSQQNKDKLLPLKNSEKKELLEDKKNGPEKKDEDKTKKLLPEVKEKINSEIQQRGEEKIPGKIDSEEKKTVGAPSKTELKAPVTTAVPALPAISPVVPKL